MPFRLLIVLLALLPAGWGARPLAAAPSVEADGTVWAGVFLGSEAPTEAGSPPDGTEAKAVAERMRRIDSLRFAHYRVLGEHVQPLLKEYESWLVPSRGLFFKLDSRGPGPDGGIRVAVQLWREKEVLLKTDVVLAGDRPVLVRGPRVGEGTLLVALRLTGKR